MISVAQIRAARAMLGLKQSDVARKAGISLSTLNKIERGIQTNPQVDTLKSIRRVLEAEGIKFIILDTGERGVSMRELAVSKTCQKVLIIDDSFPDRVLYKEWLHKHPDCRFDVFEAADAKEGYEMFLLCQPACIILDFLMYGTTGFQLLATIKRNAPVIPPIIFVTGMHSQHIEAGVRAQGINVYLRKRTLTREKFYEALKKAHLL